MFAKIIQAGLHPLRPLYQKGIEVHLTEGYKVPGRLMLKVDMRRTYTSSDFAEVCLPEDKVEELYESLGEWLRRRQEKDYLRVVDGGN